MPRHALRPLAWLLVLAACRSDEPSGPASVPLPDPAIGLVAFQSECARCHASGDGFDLAVFGFTDTTIVRRAVAHVDTATALHIVAHIRSLSVPRAEEDTRLFQPGGVTLTGDLAFALALFGRDAWPDELSTAGLRAIDPRQVRIALALPVWSDEATNLDWMPDEPVGPAILDYAGGQAAAAIAGYRAVPTPENLRRAVLALRIADRAMANPGAPCILDDPARVRFQECFEARRWTSTLVAQHMLRFGATGSLGPDVHDAWWDVGNVARRSRGADSEAVANPVENWATWMFLGWSFDPSRHPSVYTGGGFRQLGLVRHATFIALRSQVARPSQSAMPYADLLQAVRFAPLAWTAPVARFGLHHLLDRLQLGDRPARPEQIAEAVVQVETAVSDARRKVSPMDGDAIAALGADVLAALQR